MQLSARNQLRGTVTALHVDYGLRPESHDDADFCVSLCERAGVELRPRVEEFAALEAQLVLQQDPLFRFHSGPPQTD